VIIADCRGRHVGMIVDSVKEVLNLTVEKIAPKPEMGHGGKNQFITGMAKLKDNVTILMDTSGIMSDEDSAAIEVSQEAKKAA
jgi:purine-binding chemotaxis protein CheW